MDTFTTFKQKMIDKGMRKNCCNEGLNDFLNALNVLDLSIAIKNHFHFVITEGVLSPNLFATMQSQLNEHGIFCNHDCTDGYVFVTDNNSITATGRSKVICVDNSEVLAYDKTLVQSYDNSIVSGYGNVYIFANSKSLIHAYNHSNVRAKDEVVVNAYENSHIKLSGGAHGIMNDASMAIVGEKATIMNKSSAKHIKF